MPMDLRWQKLQILHLWEQEYLLETAEGPLIGRPSWFAS
jgi:hypothetical protein